MNSLVSYDSSDTDDEAGDVSDSKSGKKNKVFISLNQLKYDDEIDTIVRRNFRPEANSSKLLNVLPQPKINNDKKSSITSFIPRQFERKRDLELLEDLNEGELYDEFFNLKSTCSKPSRIPPPIKMPKIEPITSTKDNKYFANLLKETTIESETVKNEKKPELEQKDIEMLCGRNAKINRNDVRVLDVNTEEIAKENRVLMLKNLTDESRNMTMVPDKKLEGKDITLEHRKKHQITYLAQKAIENEKALSNFWAQSRSSKDQSRQKYGF